MRAQAIIGYAVALAVLLTGCEGDADGARSEQEAAPAVGRTIPAEQREITPEQLCGTLGRSEVRFAGALGDPRPDDLAGTHCTWHVPDRHLVITVDYDPQYLGVRRSVQARPGGDLREEVIGGRKAAVSNSEDSGCEVQFTRPPGGVVVTVFGNKDSTEKEFCRLARRITGVVMRRLPASAGPLAADALTPKQVCQKLRRDEIPIDGIGKPEPSAGGEGQSDLCAWRVAGHSQSGVTVFVDPEFEGVDFWEQGRAERETLGGRTAAVTEVNAEHCTIVFESAAGKVVVEVNQAPGDSSPCDPARQITKTLTTRFPAA